MAQPRRLTELEELIRTASRPVLAFPAVVALSGGADSAVAAWAAQDAGEPVRAVHVHHGLPASGRMEVAAEAVADRLGIDLSVVRVGVPEGPSPEAQARAVRYRALEEHSDPGEWIITGHHGDDQAETVLGNLLRGSAGAGLAGIPVRYGRRLRPLLSIGRSDLREFAGLLGIPFRDDPANNDLAARRNVLRHEVIPDLERRFNPSLRAGLQRTAAALGADDAALEAIAARIEVRPIAGGVLVPAPALATAPPAVAARVVRRALRHIRGPYAGSAAEIEAILGIASGAAHRAGLSGGLRAVREGPYVAIHASRDRIPGPVSWSVPGTTRFDRFLLEAWIEERPPQWRPLGGAVAVLDADAVGEEAIVRAGQEGDRIALPAGSKPVREAMREAGVPARLRAEWPVLDVHGKIAWIGAVRAAAWTWIGRDTKRFLWLTMEEETP
jgi:tRNA(Ile)-lysidine synthase